MDGGFLREHFASADTLPDYHHQRRSQRMFWTFPNASVRVLYKDRVGAMHCMTAKGTRLPYRQNIPQLEAKC